MADSRVAVEELPLGTSCSARILISKKAQKKLKKYLSREDPHRLFAQTLRRLAKEGFAPFTGDQRIVRPEGDGVYAIGIRGSLFRLAGFFSKRGEFVVIDAYWKRGQSRGLEASAIIHDVARVRSENGWKEKVNTPRIADPDDG